MLLKLLSLPVSLPAAGIRYCIEKVIEVAEAEADSVDPVKEELLELQLQLEDGTIDEQEYVARETVLLARLRDIRERQKQRLREEMEELADDEAGQGRRVYIEMPDEIR